ncbi:hypothetical protein PG985_013939 [Apiospora marii]|uniref:Uncharacterized protein n=1 Tax=Apiospora marii TaxID=335849 RepID=A0ABR1R6F6_9PEZI
MSLIHNEPAWRGTVGLLRRSGRTAEDREVRALAGLAVGSRGVKSVLQLIDLGFSVLDLELVLIVVVVVMESCVGLIGVLAQEVGRPLSIPNILGLPIEAPRALVSQCAILHDLLFCRRLMSEGVLAAVLAADDETQPRPVFDSGFVYILSRKSTRLVGGIPWLQDLTGLSTPKMAIRDGMVRLVITLGAILRVDEVFRAVIAPSVLYLLFDRRPVPGAVLSHMRAVDYQTFPRPIGDIYEMVIARFVAPEGLGQPATVQFLPPTPIEIWLKGVAVLGAILLLDAIVGIAIRRHLADRAYEWVLGLSGRRPDYPLDDLSLCGRLASVGVFTDMRAQDDETFPGTIADVRERLVAILGRVRIERDHVVFDVLHKSLGKAICSQLRTLEELRLILLVFIRLGITRHDRVAHGINADHLSSIDILAGLVVGLDAVLTGLGRGSAASEALISIGG